jgi:UDP-N-acetylmuramate dehydrogenase
MKALIEEIRKKGIAEMEEGPLMKRLTSLRIGGPAPLLIRPHSEEGLWEVLEVLNLKGVPFRVIGKGTNLLVDDRGIQEVLIDLKKASNFIRSQGPVLAVGAGTSLEHLLSFCEREGLSGLEGLCGIPGSVGGAIKGNAGAWGYEIGDRVEYLIIYNAQGKRERREELNFSYRRGPLREGEVIWEVGIRLFEGDPQEIRERTRFLRLERKKTQPLDFPSAGCVFKNPPKGPPAGYLIDKAGFKGQRRGGAMVSPLHANFILNVGDATFSDVMGLIEEIRERVFKLFNVELELEVEVWS